jgi:sigma-B regulation protein RsbU (phosphoserine phosphatase)
MDKRFSDPSIRVLLVDDQPIIAEAIKHLLEGDSNIKFYYCKDGTKALQKALEISPTVILQDLMMPDINGLDLLKYFRAHSQTKEIPMIVLSAREEPIIKAKAFALGANDYLVKIPSKEELLARVHYHSNAYHRLLQRNEAYDKLEKSEKLLLSELKEAAGYVESLLPRPIKDDPISIDWRFIPSTQLGGDAFSYHWIDDDHFAFCLLDVCGHGVGAALLSVSVVNVLRSQSLPKTDFLDPVSVLNSLNNTFPMEKHNEMFFSMWYGVYSQKNKEITYSNAGHPPPVLISDKTEEPLSTNGFMVGISSKPNFQKNSKQVKAGDIIYIFSDGAFEIPKPDGTMLSYEDFVSYLCSNKDKGLDAIVQHIQEENGSPNLNDDLCLIKITI